VFDRPMAGFVRSHGARRAADRPARRGPHQLAVRAFTNLRISTKIVTVALVISSIFAVIAVVGLFSIRNLAAQQEQQYRTNVLALSHMTDARSAVGSQLEAVVSHILSEPGFYRNQYENAIRETDQRLDTNLAALHEVNLARSEMQALESFESLLKMWRTARDTALAASRNGDRQQATTFLLVRSESVARSVKMRADAVLSQLVESVATAARQSLDSSRTTERLMLLLLAAGALIAITLALLAARTMSRPLREAVDVLTAVGQGDFRRRLAVRGNDEFGQMGQALNETLVALRDAFAGLRHEAYHDSLTGLANRTLIRQTLTDAFARSPFASSIALLVIDLDGFKEINDTYSHKVGDQLLITVADRLRNGLRGTDDTAARLGGDEFAVMLDGFEEPASAYEVADRLLTSIGEPFTVSGIELRPRASIGIALRREHAGIDDLIHDADIAMYAAKAAGKNNVVRFEHLTATL
jgi:diguanylate cyclase (GGDEF)-like protein